MFEANLQFVALMLAIAVLAQSEYVRKGGPEYGAAGQGGR